MLKPIRTFIAFELPANVLSAIRQVQDDITAYRFKASWVHPAKIHLTLKFLGDTRAEAIPCIGKAIRKAAETFPPVQIRAGGLGVFPGISRARVVWVGIGGETELLHKLQASLTKELNEIGFTGDNRPFKGHLTLGRFKKRPDPKKLLKAIEKWRGFESEFFRADRVILFKSDLKPEGAIYSRLMSVELENDGFAEKGRKT